MNKLLITLALLPATYAMADDSAEKGLKLSAEVGILNITGNSESTSVKSKLDIKQEFTSWRNSYLIEGLYKKDTVKVDENEIDQLTAKKYFASAQTDYKLDEKHRGLFIYTSYEYDKFSGYEYQATIAAGYSDRLFKTDSSFLNYSIGPGVAFSKAEDSVVDGTVVEGESDSSPVVRLYAFYQYDISEGAKFTQLLSSDVAVDSENNTKSKSETAITAQLSASFALKAAYSVTHNSEVPDNIEAMDANTSVTLVYSF